MNNREIKYYILYICLLQEQVPRKAEAFVMQFVNISLIYR